MDKTAFNLQYQDVAQRTAEKLGVPAEALLAQWGLETGYGKSIVPGTNNLGNIKDFSGKGVVAQDNATKSIDKYRAYQSVDAFADDFTNLIQRKYPKAVGQKSVEGFATALKAGGYAEDPDYVNKMVRVAGGTPSEAAPAAKPPSRFDALIEGVTQVEDARRLDQSKFNMNYIGLAYRTEDAIRTNSITPGVLGTLGAVLGGNTDQLVNRVFFSTSYPEEPGFKPDWAKLPANADRDLLDAFAKSKSTLEAEKVLRDFDDEQVRLQTVGRLGTLPAVGMALGGELLSATNWVTGFAGGAAFAKAGYSATAAARAGRYGAAMARGATENLITGTAVEAALQTADGKFDLANAGINGIADAFIGVATGGWGARAGALKMAAETIERTKAAKFVEELAYAERASAKLGPSATPEAIIAEVQALKQADTAARVRVNTEQRGVFDVEVPEEKVTDVQASMVPTEATRFAATGNEQRVATALTADARFKEMSDLGVFKYTDDFEERRMQVAMLKAEPGVHLGETVATSGSYQRQAKVMEKLRAQFIPDVAIHLTDGGTGLGNATGIQGILKPNMSMVALRPGSNMRVMVHEFMHVVFAHRLSKASPEVQQAMVAEWEKWFPSTLKEGGAQESMLRRSPLGATADIGISDGKRGPAAYVDAVKGDWAGTLQSVFDNTFPDKVDEAEFKRYFTNFDEFSAEQGVKYLEARAMKIIGGPLKVPAEIIRMLAGFIREALSVFKFAKDNNLLAPSEPFKRFLDDVLAGNQKSKLSPLDMSTAVSDTQQMAVPTQQAVAVVNEFLNDPDAIKYGLSNLPVSTPAERKKAQAIKALHQKAEKWAIDNPKDAAWDKRAKNWADNDVFNVASIGLVMLKSDSPLVRMIASELLEDSSGVAGVRKSTADITKYIIERRIQGNALLDVERSFDLWVSDKPGRIKDSFSGGEYRKEFNKLVFEEVERRGQAGYVAQTPASIPSAAIVKAADAMQAAFKRSADEQIKAKTLGHEALDGKEAYMTHRISPALVRGLTNEQSRILHSALVDQFVTIEGWDMTFADKLASKYMERVVKRANGDFSSTVGGNSAESSELVREALIGLKLPEQVIADHMASFTKGAANFTKKRLNLDLHRVYETPQGPFKLLDVFETDPITLIRAQAQRASGEVALASKGIKGKPGMELLREAMQYGEDGKKANDKQLAAFDQAAAELFSAPFGTKATRWMERAMSANVLIRMGSSVIYQLGEVLNGVFHVGAMKTLDSVAGIPRLKGEIDALVRGEVVDNPIISSLETTGTEFGLDDHRVVMPYDSPDHAYPTYGQDTLTMTDRLLRGGGYLQAKLSGWRLIHSTQQRGMAEQVTKKVFRYIREGKEDVALQGFGITPELRAKLEAELPNIAEFAPNGSLEALDITKMADQAAASELVQVVHRGVNQIIQGTFIGERGKWAHEGWLKLLLQFRSFPIIAMEKQWGRQVNTRGVVAALGMLVGSMSIAAPLHMARVYAASIGREDQQEFINQRLTPQAIAMATMNYVAMSGLFGDFMQLLTAVSPDEFKEATGLQQVGTRVGTESDFIGSFIAPSADLVNDLWKYAQSPGDFKEGARLFPGGRIPYMIPLINAIPKSD